MLDYLARRLSQAIRIVRAMRLCRRHFKRFGRRPVLVIVGARDGVRGPLALLAVRRLIDVIGFEPDELECERMRARQPYVRFEPLALGESDHQQKFYITDSPGCSSCLEPDPQVLARYPIAQWFKVNRVVEVPVHRFDHLYPQRIDVRPDFIQIDVQGYESRVLEGFGEHLLHVVGLETEAHLRALYKGQSLLWDLRDLLDRHGMVLRHLRPQGAFEGELVETEIWFSRLGGELSDERRSLLQIWETICFLPTLPVFNPNAWPREAEPRINAS